MKSSPLRCALGSAAALLFFAGCSGGPSSLIGSGQGGSAQTQSSMRAPAGYRVVPGPAVAGPQLIPLAPHNGPGYILPGATTQELGYVADANNNDVVIFTAKKREGVITQGINVPFGLAVDSAGTLYVANIGNNTVTEYPLGQTSPSFTITGGMSSPYGIGVDSSGNVFVSNLGTNTVTGYMPGQTSPFESVGGVGPNPVGVAVDSKNDVYVADDSDNTIYVIPAGSSTAQNSGLTQLSGPIGVAFNAADTLYVANFAANQVAIYPSGSTSPSGTITSGIDQPTLNGFARPGAFFQSDQTGPVVGYKPNQSSPFVTLHGIGRPAGIASSPRVVR